MRRRRATVALGLGLLACIPLHAAPAQPAGAQPPLVGVLAPPSATAAKANIDAFRQGLREVGLVEGRSVAVELRYGDGAPERFPALAAELVALKPRVIVAGSAPGVLAVSRATRSIPIVLVSPFGDPVALGVAASLARPGGNVTGFSLVAGADLYGKRLQILKEVLGSIVRIAVMLNPNDATDTVARSAIKAVAPALGLAPDFLDVTEKAQFESGFAAARERADALLVSQSPLFFTNRADVVALANRHRLPAIFGFGEFARDGGLLSYSVSLPDMYRRSAEYVARILKGEHPSDLPIQQPTKFELVVNLKTADALGITVPQSVLLQADEVIE
jgi:putative ABC transport system substrate-binding protein